MKKIVQEKNDLGESQRSQGNKVITMNKNRKKLIVSLVMIAAICVVAIGFWGIKEYLKITKYNSAVEKYKAGDYSEAETLFLSLLEYKDAPIYLTECSYQRAILDFEAGKYNQAIDTFFKLGDYEDAEVYLKKAVLERKHAEFNTSVDIEPKYFFQAGIKTPEEVEEEMSSRMYGVWFNMDTNEEITVSYDEIGNRPYGVNYATCTGSTVVVNFHYLDDPHKAYDIANGYEEFYYIDEYVATLSISQANSETGEAYAFSSIPLEEYKAFDELNSQAASQQQIYSNDEIIQKALSTFQSKIRGYYSGTEMLYHAVDYSDAYVTYDWTSKIYTCTFIGEYSTNVFDFWGTSTQTYFVSAEYLDTGSGLVMLSFNIS